MPPGQTSPPVGPGIGVGVPSGSPFPGPAKAAVEAVASAIARSAVMDARLEPILIFSPFVCAMPRCRPSMEHPKVE